MCYTSFKKKNSDLIKTNIKDFLIQGEKQEHFHHFWTSNESSSLWINLFPVSSQPFHKLRKSFNSLVMFLLSIYFTNMVIQNMMLDIKQNLVFKMGSNVNI